MFEQILVATDGSPWSRETLPAAIALAGQFDGEILVLHVSEHYGGRAAVYSLETPAGATIMVADAVNRLRDLGRAARGQIRDVAPGHMADAIVETAEENGIDLIVMGSLGLSDAHEFILGRVTHEVIQGAAIPVLVVRPPAQSSVKA